MAASLSFLMTPTIIYPYSSIFIGNRDFAINLQLYFMNNPQEYIRNCLNRSVSKYTYAFPKADRFEKSRKLPTEAKYTLPPTFDKRSCSFGYGNKLSLIIDRCSPPPGSYESQSEFNKSGNKRNSPSFGLNRDIILFGSYLSSAKKKAEEIPCPNRYDIKLPKAHIGGTMGIRMQTEPAIKKRHSPGPGAYDLHSIDMANSSTIILSNYKKSISPKYYQTKTIDVNNFKNSRKANFYEIQEKEFGKSKVSKFRNVSITSFGKQKKLSTIDKWKLRVPGSKYNVFSEFGSSYK